MDADLRTADDLQTLEPWTKPGGHLNGYGGSLPYSLVGSLAICRPGTKRTSLPAPRAYT